MLFKHKKVRFKPIDPLDNGLREEIAAEQLEPDHFVLDDLLDGTLAEKWEEILTDARRDPEFVFVDDEN